MATSSLARGIGRLGYREGREFHLVLAGAEQQHPGISREDVRRGWYAERAEGVTEPGQIGGGR